MSLKRSKDLVLIDYYSPPSSKNKVLEGLTSENPNEKEISPEERRRSEKNRNWLFSHYEELSRQYQDQTIAVANEQVIAAGKDPEKVVSTVEKMNFDSKVIIVYIDRKDRLY